jgi:hypothetical protein
MTTRTYYTRDRNLLVVIYFLFYYAVLLGFFLDDRLLSQYHPIFFNFNRDLTELALIATGIPRYMIAHPAWFTIADILAFLLPLPLIFREARQTGHPETRPANFSPWPGLLFVCYLAFYLLLADIFWQVHHEPFILLLVLALVWTTGRPDRFYLILKGCRYYFLYIFVSAAIWKLARGAVFNSEEMSRILLLHHTDLLTGDCTSLACRFYSWLIAHSTIAQSLYLAAFVLEAIFVMGFFTRRWDRLLIALTILFVLADLLVMRIPYWTILLGTIPLWMRDRAGDHGDDPLRLPNRPHPQPRKKKIALYETTHHENLPALLDLSQAHFGQVTVFLKELSYLNLTGDGSPEQRWPRIEFYIQPTGSPNRRFIRQLFRHIRRHGYTHLHLCTLDNNLLFFALRLAFIGPVHVSLTIHEVNEFLSGNFGSLRSWTETFSKPILRRLIRHFHFFLPAMAREFSRRQPGATTVFIPSRFYSGHHPAPPAQPFRIVIPGSLDPNRRNYADVTKTVALLRASPSLPPIELVLLGDSGTDAAIGIITTFESITSNRLAIRSFKGYVPERTYEQELAGAHLIWSPLNIHKKSSRNSTETYGLTTASGLTSDLLLYNTPALVPADLIIPELFQPATYPYRSPEEACAIIRRLVEDPIAYTALRGTIHHAFSFFTKENFSPAFAELTRP